MVGVYITARGDVVYNCNRCSESITVPVEMHKTPFWDHYNGTTILQMLEHYRRIHPRPPNG